jgi:hypothetical protein
MNFNSDYQSHQNRIRTHEFVNLSLNTAKTKTKSQSKQNKVRILLEILFVLTAVGLGYMQGLNSFYAENASKAAKIQAIKK